MQDVSVKCFYFSEQVVWKNASEGEWTKDENLHVWKIQLPQDERALDEMTELLTEQEKERFDRYYKEDDKKRYAAGRVVLKILLGQYLHQSPETVQIKEETNKKPFILSNGKKDLQFNLSHSGDCVLIAVSTYDVGVDVEFINKNFRYDDIIISAFSVEEREFVKQSGQRDKAFYLLWTRKEALLKGTGKGLTDNLPAIPSLNGVHTISGGNIDSVNSWQICSFDAQNGYVASVAYSEKIDRISFFLLNAEKHLGKELIGYLKTNLAAVKGLGN